MKLLNNFSSRCSSQTLSARERELRQVRGISQVGMLFLVAVVGAVLWVLFQVIPFFYDYYELEGQAVAQANKASLFTDAQIHKELSRWIRTMGIPIGSPEELKINRFDKKIVIELKYTEVLEFELLGKYYELWEFPFELHVEKEY